MKRYLKPLAALYLLLVFGGWLYFLGGWVCAAKVLFVLVFSAFTLLVVLFLFGVFD